MIPRVRAFPPRQAPAPPGRTVLALLAAVILILAACDGAATITPAPDRTPASTACPPASANPDATPWNGGSGTPPSPGLSTPCPSAAPSAATTPRPSAAPATTGPSEPTETDEPGETDEPEPSDEPEPTDAAGSPQPTFVIHTVRAGENLTSIALRYDTHPRSIAYWNRDTYPSLDPDSPSYRPDYLEVGWKLRLIPGVTLDDQGPLPTRRPTPRPSVSIPPPPTVEPGQPSAVISNGPRGTPHVALTFDMGGELGPALAIVRFLIENDVRATIFPTGEAASVEELGIEVMELVASKPDLFAVGNHSWDHPNFTELTPEEIADQLQQTEQAILDATGRSSKPFFRPPFGAHNADVRQAVADAGWAYAVMWDIDTIDWRPTADGGPTADDIVAKVLGRAEGGSIVLMHLGGYHTLEALPRILSGLRDRGLEPVTLPQLLGL